MSEQAADFVCKSCGHDISAVIDSRGNGRWIRRRRKCLRCGVRFTTYETTTRPDAAHERTEGLYAEIHGVLARYFEAHAQTSQ